MNSHTDLQYNGLKSLMNYDVRIDIDMNATLHNGDVSSWIGLLNRHTLPQYNESSNLSYMNMNVGNVDINGDYCYRNGSTGPESKNHKSIDYKKKRYGISTNRYLMENNG